MPIYTDVISLSGSPVAGDSAMPVLRDMGDRKSFEASEDVLRKNPKIGTHANFRILPYTMQNNYKRDTATISIKTIVYENSILESGVFCLNTAGVCIPCFTKSISENYCMSILCSSPHLFVARAFMP